MLRQYVCGVFALVVAVSCLLAAEYKGKVKSVDADKNTITVTVDDKDKDFKIDDSTKIVNAKGKDVKNGLRNEKNFKAGAAVTVTTDKKDGKEVVTEIKLAGGKKKDK